MWFYVALSSKILFDHFGEKKNIHYILVKCQETFIGKVWYVDYAGSDKMNAWKAGTCVNKALKL